MRRAAEALKNVEQREIEVIKVDHVDILREKLKDASLPRDPPVPRSYALPRRTEPPSLEQGEPT